MSHESPPAGNSAGQENNWATSAYFFENHSRRGVEIRFNAKPHPALQSKLRAVGFLPGKIQFLWYADHSDVSVDFAEQICTILPNDGEGPYLYLKPSYQASKVNIESKRFSVVYFELSEGRSETYLIFEPSKPKAEVIARNFAKEKFGRIFVDLAVKPKSPLRDARHLFENTKLIETTKNPGVTAAAENLTVDSNQTESTGPTPLVEKNSVVISDIINQLHRFMEQHPVYRVPEKFKKEDFDKWIKENYPTLKTQLWNEIWVRHSQLVRIVKRLGKLDTIRIETDPYSAIYDLLLKLIPDLLKYLKSGEYFYGRSKLDGITDLFVDFISTSKEGYELVLYQYYTLNGDRVPDPDMEIRVYPETQTAEALIFRDITGYEAVYEEKDGKETVNLRMKKKLNAFLKQWLTRLLNKGHQVKLISDSEEKAQENAANNEQAAQKHEAYKGDLDREVYPEGSIFIELGLVKPLLQVKVNRKTFVPKGQTYLISFPTYDALGHILTASNADAFEYKGQIWTIWANKEGNPIIAEVLEQTLDAKHGTNTPVAGSSHEESTEVNEKKKEAFKRLLKVIPTLAEQSDTSETVFEHFDANDRLRKIDCVIKPKDGELFFTETVDGTEKMYYRLSYNIAEQSVEVIAELLNKEAASELKREILQNNHLTSSELKNEQLRAFSYYLYTLYFDEITFHPEKPSGRPQAKKDLLENEKKLTPQALRTFTPYEESVIQQKFSSLGYACPFTLQVAIDQNVPVMDVAFRYQVTEKHFNEVIKPPLVKELEQLEQQRFDDASKRKVNAGLDKQIAQLHEQLDAALKVCQNEFRIFQDDLIGYAITSAKQKGKFKDGYMGLEAFADYINENIFDGRAIEPYHREPLAKVLEMLISDYDPEDILPGTLSGKHEADKRKLNWEIPTREMSGEDNSINRFDFSVLAPAFWQPDFELSTEKVVIGGQEFLKARIHQVFINLIGKLPRKQQVSLALLVQSRFSGLRFEDYFKRQLDGEFKGKEKAAARYIDDLIKMWDYPSETFPVCTFLFQTLIKDESLADDPIHLVRTQPKQNQHQLNMQIEKLIEKKDKNKEAFTEEDKKLIARYTGSGGLAKDGAKTAGLLYEFYTPPELVKIMWGLAFLHGYEKGAILEPAVGTGRFLDHAPDGAVVVGYETNRVSARIAQILHPTAQIHNKAFESLFFKGNKHLKDTAENMLYSLVIGNPPYGPFTGKYAGMGEKNWTKALEYEHYFLLRALDLLEPGGLLVFLVPSNFLRNNLKYNAIKDKIYAKADLIDAYRLPNGIFQTTDIGADIVVLRKRRAENVAASTPSKEKQEKEVVQAKKDGVCSVTGLKIKKGDDIFLLPNGNMIRAIKIVDGDNLSELAQGGSWLFKIVEEIFDNFMKVHGHQDELFEKYVGEDAIYEKHGAIQGAIEAIFETMREDQRESCWLHEIPITDTFY